ncbi:hypothetical protein ACLB2K_062296 [Fragaria x ananassa]
MECTVEVMQMVCPLGQYAMNNKGSFPPCGSFPVAFGLFAQWEHCAPHRLALSKALSAGNFIIGPCNTLLLKDEIVESSNAIFIKVLKLLPHCLDVIVTKQLVLFLDAKRGDMDLQGKNSVMAKHESIRGDICRTSFGGTVGPQAGSSSASSLEVVKSRRIIKLANSRFFINLKLRVVKSRRVIKLPNSRHLHQLQDKE